MKILGYIDDFVSWFVNWQVSMGWWNLIIVPIELIIIFWVYFTFTPRCIYP